MWKQKHYYRLGNTFYENERGLNNLLIHHSNCKPLYFELSILIFITYITKESLQT